MLTPGGTLINLLPEFRRLSAEKSPSSARSYLKGVRSLAEYLRSVGSEVPGNTDTAHTTETTDCRHPGVTAEAAVSAGGHPAEESRLIDNGDCPGDALTGIGADFESQFGRLLAGWMLDMHLRGLSLNTSLLFFDIISGLYSTAVRRGLAVATEAFKTVKSEVKEVMSAGEEPVFTRSDYSAVMECARKTAALISSGKGMPSVPETGPRPLPAADLLLLALLNPEMDMPAILAVRRRDTVAFDVTSAAVLNRHASSRRQYVFDLATRPVTARGYLKISEPLMRSLFNRVGVRSSLSAAGIISSVWALSALKGGVSPEDVIGVIGRIPQGIPLLRLFGRSEISPSRLGMIKRVVSSAFSGDPYRWYAMRLRPRVKFSDLAGRLSDLSGELTLPRLFYPSEEIARRTGRRLEFETRPVIKDVVFFRSRLTDILPLFSRIGDMAWCYTTTGRPGAPYAPIPRRAFERFQQTVGSFTPDFEVATWGGLTPREGERVVMVGGLFEGQEADVEQVKLKESERAIYRLRFYSDNGIEWRIATDQFVRPNQ